MEVWLEEVFWIAIFSPSYLLKCYVVWKKRMQLFKKDFRRSHDPNPFDHIFMDVIMGGESTNSTSSSIICDIHDK